MLPLLPIVALHLGCSGLFDTEDTAPDAAAEVVLPVLTITSPERGAFVTSGSAVLVAGRAQAGTHALESLEINDLDVALEDDGSFSYTFTPDAGINVIGVRVEDVGGERAVDGRSVYAQATHDNGATLDGAVRMQLGPDVLDDDSPDLDDLSAILEVVLLDPAVTDVLVGETFETDEGIEVTPTSLSLASASVDLTPANGQLDAVITLHDVWMDYDASYSWLYSSSGSAWMDRIVLTMGIEAEVTASGASADVVDVSATLHGYGLTLDWFPDWLEDDLADWTQETLEDALTDSVRDLAGDTLSETLDAFAVEYSAADGVDLGLELAGIDTDSRGLYLTFDAWVEGSGMALPTGARSLSTAGAGPAFPLSSRPFAVALDDDLMNQIFFAFWASGAVHDMTYGELELAVLVGEPLPPPLGPVETLVIDLGLPPVVGPSGPDSERSFRLGVGELTMDITRDDGVQVLASLNFFADADLSLDADGALEIALDDRPKYVPVEAGILVGPEALDPGDLAALFRLMTPTLVGSLGDFLPAFELPALPLDALGDVDALAGQTLVPSDVDLGLDDGDWTLIEGDLVPGD